MAFTIPSPTPTSVTNPDWVNQLAYLVVAKEKLRQDYNSHGDQFEAQTLSEEDWVACVWTDLERANGAIRDTRLNRCCGKWNHVYDAAMFKSRRMAQAAVDDFFCELGLFLPNGSKQP